MIAGNYIIEADVTASGGTADFDYQFDAEAVDAMRSAEKEAQIRENLMILFMRLGAVLSRGGGSVKYWRNTKFQFNFDFNITPCLSWSGFV
jgi:hypothetical protein